MKLGTAVLTPFRPALVTAQLLGGLSFLSRGRLELGVGPGTPRAPWEALDVPYDQRVDRCREMVEVVRVVAGGGPASYAGVHTRFEDVTIDPAPPPDLPVWYGGASAASVRAVRRYADGIIPGRCPFPILDRARDDLERAAQEDARQYRVGTIPLVSVGRDRESALAKLPMEAILRTARDRWHLQVDGVEDLAGALIHGGPDDILEDLHAFEARGIELVIVDLRLLMPEFEEAAERFAEVMSSLSGPPARAVTEQVSSSTAKSPEPA